MTYRISRVDTNRFEIKFDEEPRNLVALQMAPAGREPELDRCEWLILSFAVWSGSDRDQISIATSLAGALRHLLVGVRPFDDFGEFQHWLPGEVSRRSPVWVRLLNGQLMWTLSGAASADEITARLQE